VAVIQEGDLPAGWIEKVNAYLEQHGFGPDAGKADEQSPAGPKFSHAWVVGKKRTNTGSSVLVSDPQTPVNNPALFYEYHIQGKTFNARGIGVPGSPVLLIGFSENVAWGCTALGADQADLFRLTTAPDKPDQYQVDGTWQAMQVRQETVKVKGGQDRRITLRETRFGPVVTAFAFTRPDEGQVAVKRIPICETERETIQGALAMLRARNVREFDKALEGWRFPSINSLFGDRHGDIGYRTAVAQPLRAPGVTDLNSAQDGSRARHDWQGIVPHELMPHVINPRSGALFSGNHRAIGAAYRVPIGNATGSQGDTVRSWRLRELITATERFTPEEVLQIHYDTVNPSHRDIVQLGYHLRDQQQAALSESTRRALDFLEPWREQGCRMDNRLHGTALVGNLNTMFRVMNTELAMEYGGGQTGLCRFMQSATRRIGRAGGTLTEQEARYIDDLLADAWGKTVQQFGTDPGQWLTRHREALGRQKLPYFQSLDGYGSLDPQHDLNTPALTCTDGNTILSQRAQSYTQFVPVHDPDRALTILPIGSSEIPGRPFYANLMEDWAQGKLHPAPLSRGAVEKIAGKPVILRMETGG
jgi:penicillin amidase